VDSQWLGEIKATASGVIDVDDGPFTTFTLVKGSYVFSGVYEAALSRGSIYGGEVALDPRTAWVYWQYLSGTIVPAVDTDERGAQLQIAIWALQGQVDAPAPGSNAYYDLAQDAPWTDIWKIRVLNLQTVQGDQVEDVAVLDSIHFGGSVPEPITFFGFIGAGIVVARRWIRGRGLQVFRARALQEGGGRSE